MSGTNPPLSVGGPPSAAASARATQNLKRSVQAAFDGKTYLYLAMLHVPYSAD